MFDQIAKLMRDPRMAQMMFQTGSTMAGSQAPMGAGMLRGQMRGQQGLSGSMPTQIPQGQQMGGIGAGGAMQGPPESSQMGLGGDRRGGQGRGLAGSLGMRIFGQRRPEGFDPDEMGMYDELMQDRMGGRMFDQFGPELDEMQQMHKARFGGFGNPIYNARQGLDRSLFWDR